MAQLMAAPEPTNDKLKYMFWRINFYYDADTELVTGKGIDSIEEIKTLKQDRVTHL